MTWDLNTHQNAQQLASLQNVDVIKNLLIESRKMGNCLGTCFGQAKKKTNYFVGRYKDYNVSIEFENLIDDENAPSSDNPVITDTERQHLLNKKFSDLENEQRLKNAELDAELRRQEENLMIEEDAMNEAKREAARLAKQARAQEQDKKNKKKITANGSANKPSWLGDDEDWDVAGGEDDFEMFLDSVKARSQAVRANGFLGNTAVSLRPYHRKGQTPAKSTSEKTPLVTPKSTQKQLQHQEGMKESTSKTTPSVASTSSQQQLQHQGGENNNDSDLEWDSDFVSADTIESSPVPVSNGMSLNGTDSDNKQRTSDDVKVVSPRKHKDAQPSKVAANVTDKTALIAKNAGIAVTSSVATAKNPGIGMKPAVQLPNSTSQPNSIKTDSTASKVATPANTAKPKDLSNPISVQETAATTVTKMPNNSTRTENPVDATGDGKAEGQGSFTKVVEDSTESLDEFDIDKFLEELDFDT